MKRTCGEEHAGARLDVFVADAAEISRTAAARLIDSGNVTVNGRAATKKYPVAYGDEIEISVPEPEEATAEPEDIPLNVVYEDGDIIVINKPQGMVVHPAPGNERGTLVNALLHHCRGTLSGIGGVMRPGIVHRIDKDTSGLLVVAKNDEAHAALARELETHGVVREYHALVRGGFSADAGTVDAPIGRHPVDRKRMAVLPEGAHAKRAVTHYRVNASYGDISYLTLRLETGRTHQIRVHMAHIGHPLLGDPVYAKNVTRFEKLHAALLSGQALHAKRLELTHPRSGERMIFECELPENFQKLLTILEKERTE